VCVGKESESEEISKEYFSLFDLRTRENKRKLKACLVECSV